MNRRSFLRAGTTTAVGLSGLAGCLGTPAPSGTLRVATYESFFGDEGYANPETMARFADAPNADLAADFMDFVLSREAQSVVPERNVQFPATTYDDVLSETFGQYAKRPPEPVTFTYQDLAGNVNEWVDTWAKEIASK